MIAGWIGVLSGSHHYTAVLRSGKLEKKCGLTVLIGAAARLERVMNRDSNERTQ
jgi:hypothetical protein